MFSAHRLELAAIDAAIDQVRAALRDRDAEHAVLDATDVANTLQILTLRAANQRGRKQLAALMAERPRRRRALRRAPRGARRPLGPARTALLK